MVRPGIGFQRATASQIDIDMGVTQPKLSKDGKVLHQIEIETSKPLEGWPAELIVSSRERASLCFYVRKGHTSAKTDIGFKATEPRGLTLS